MNKKSLLLLGVAVLILASAAGVTTHVLSQGSPPSGPSKEIQVNGQEIKVAPAAAQRIGLETAVLQPVNEPVLLQLTGKTALNMERTVHVKPQFPGKLMDIGPALGTPVKGPKETPGGRGAFLCKIESVDLANVKQTYLKADTQLKLDKDFAQRTRELVEAKTLAERFLKEAEAAVVKDEADVEAARQNLFVFGVKKEDLPKITTEVRGERMAYDLYSPISGVIAEKNVTRGEYADSTVNLFTIADTSTLWVWGDVYEKDWNKVNVGQKIKVQIAAFPRRLCETVIDMVAPALDPVTRGIRIRGTVDNEDRKILTDMYCDLSVLIDEGRNSLIVPPVAVLRGLQASEAYVFVRKTLSGTDGYATYEKRPVRFEEIGDGRIRLLEGVKAGEWVVTVGAAALYEEMRHK